LVKFPIDKEDLKPFGKSGERVPAIGLGTYGIRNFIRALEAYVRAVEMGLNLIDTAEMYSDGLAEEFVGRVVREVGRSRVFIVTKLLPHRFADPETAVRAAEASLRRLGVISADLILIHWPSDVLPVEVQIRSLEAIAERGLTRFIGVSNFKLKELQEAVQATKKYEIAVNQVKYSVLDKKIERDLLPYAIRNSITIQAYTPLEHGRVALEPTLIRIANKYGKTPIQVALNFLISRPMVTAIPKAEKVDHVEEIHGALGWRLSAEDIEVIEKL